VAVPAGRPVSGRRGAPGGGTPGVRRSQTRITARGLTPYQRLARVHALMAAGDSVMAVALAGSLFFDISPDAARPKVLLFLAISVAPFAVVAPLIGPAIDRMAGGRRLVVQIIAAGRFVIALLMMANLDSLLLFPLAFAALVLQKTYTVSKSALVPTVVHSQVELVEANSKLGIISGVVGLIAAIPAGILHFIGAPAPLLLDALFFLAALVAATQLPREVVASKRAERAEKQELRSTAVVLAASAMGLLRASVGFLFFHLAFWLRDQKAGTALFGIGVASAAVGTMIGNSIGPRLRRAVREELMLIVGLAISAVVGVAAALAASVVTAILLMTAVNLGAALGRLGFDAIVQRSAPDANQGRAFAQFETKFQLAWVSAGLVPLLIPIPGWLGFAIVGGLAAFAMATYLVSMRRVRLGRPLPEPLTTRARRMAAERRAAQRAAPRRESAAPDAPRAAEARRWIEDLPPPPKEPPVRRSPLPPPPPTNRSGDGRPDLTRG